MEMMAVAALALIAASTVTVVSSSSSAAADQLLRGGPSTSCDGDGKQGQQILCLPHDYSKFDLPHRNDFNMIDIGNVLSTSLRLCILPEFNDTSGGKEEGNAMALACRPAGGRSNTFIYCMALLCMVHHTGLGKRVGPGLRESRLLTPSGHGGEFTQPRGHSFAQPCTYKFNY